MHVWQNGGVGNKKIFLKLLKTRLIETYTEEWTSAMQNNDRYSIFYSYKSCISLSSYLVSLKHIEARNTLIKIRLGVSQLKTHSARYTYSSNYSDEDVICPTCKEDIETVKHFVLVCPTYEHIRKDYLPSKYYINPTLFKLTLIMATENPKIISQLALYLVKAFELRSAFCN